MGANPLAAHSMGRRSPGFASVFRSNRNAWPLAHHDVNCMWRAHGKRGAYEFIARSGTSWVDERERPWEEWDLVVSGFLPRVPVNNVIKNNSEFDGFAGHPQQVNR